MSYLLEALGRGLLADLRSAFENQLPGPDDEDTQRLRQRFAASPRSFDLAMRLGMSCLREMRLADARRALETAWQVRPDSTQPLLGLACVYDELGQLGRAIEYLIEAQRLDDQDPAIAFGIGFCHERLGERRQARLAYLKAIDLCPQLRNAYERLAAIAIRDGQFGEAVEQYERLAEMEPGDVDVLLTLGSLYLKTHRAADAVEQYQRALLVEPGGVDDSGDTPEDLVGESRLAEAIQALERLVQKYPGMAPFHVRLGDLYAKAGDDERATEHYRAALQTQPTFLEATVKLGTQHMRQGRYVDAAVTFNRAVELNDRLMTAFVGLGVAQHDCGRRQESLASFDLAASLEPSSTLLYSETTRLQLKSEREQRALCSTGGLADGGDNEPVSSDELLAEALRRHQQALLNAPDHADLHYRCGLLLRQLGRYEDAIQAFRHAIAINPSYCKAMIKLAVSLKECGEVDEAITMFQRALQLNDKYVDVHYELGVLFAQRNQFDLAAEQFEQALASGGGSAAFRANLALALQNIGMVDRAAATWRSICELQPTDPGLLSAREQALRNAKRG